jgi:hypothetical protein
MDKVRKPNISDATCIIVQNLSIRVTFEIICANDCLVSSAVIPVALLQQLLYAASPYVQCHSMQSRGGTLSLNIYYFKIWRVQILLRPYKLATISFQPQTLTAGFICHFLQLLGFGLNWTGFQRPTSCFSCRILDWLPSQSHIATDGQSVSLGVEPHLELTTRYLLLFDSYGHYVGRPL